jgi:ABC-2 type transport system permease protein
MSSALDAGLAGTSPVPPATPRSSGARGLMYVRMELVRSFRNRRFMLFTLGFPIALYFAIAAPNHSIKNFGGTGVSAPLYYMVSLASFGTMMAMISCGTRIAAERQVGWTRQLRITPLNVRAYFLGKVVVGYAAAITTILLLYVCGAVLGVSMPAGTWLEITGLILVALLPFAALGVALGHLLNVDSIGPATGGLVSLLALVSGTWFPITHGFLHDVGQFLPSYWLAQAGRIAVHGQGWGVMGWAVVVGWGIVLLIAARFAYRRDTERV